MAEPDALLIAALTRLSQQGGYEAAGDQMYPGLYPTDPSLAPMPSFDGGRRSMGGQYERSAAYGGGPLGGMGLLGGLPRPPRPNLDTTPGELDVEAAAGGWIQPTPAEKTWPDFGVPFIPPAGPQVAAPVVPPPGPVDLSKIPSDIPLLAPGPSYPGVSAGPAPVPGGLLPPSAPPPHQSYGAPWNRQVVTPTVAQTPDIRQAPGDVTAAPGDVGPEGRNIAKRPTPPDPRDTQPYRPDFGIVSAEAGGGDDDDAYKGLNISDDKKAEIETSANNAKDFLYGGGYVDTGQHGFAQSLMLLYGGGLEPTVTQGPAAQFNVRGQPMTTNRYLNFATGGASVPSLLPEGQRLGQVAPSGDVATAGDADKKTTTRPGGLGFDADKIANYNSDKSFDIISSSLFPPTTGRTPDGGYYFNNDKDFQEWATGVKFGPSIENASKYNYNIFDADGKIVGFRNKIVDGFQDFTNFIQSGFDWLGDPSKTKGENATLKSVEKSYEGFINEATQFWHTNPNNLWGRKLFKPGETQDYGSLQPYAIMASILNPPQALATFANTLVHDLFYAAKNTFSENPNYAGNPIQDIFNGAFHLFGRGIKAIGKNAKKLFTGKEGVAEGADVEGETTTGLEGEDAFMKQLFREQKDNSLRTLWDEHKMHNSAAAAITEAFSAAGIPIVLYEKSKDLARAIQQRKQADARKLYDEIKNDLGGMSIGSSGDLFNLQSFMREYSFDEGWQQFLKELENQHKKSGQS
jgi:hypothetical protein